jgi:uroporphyrinogen decarboxylase
MNSRERVLETLAHREPDRVPHNLRPSAGMIERLQQEQGNPDVDFSDVFGHDIRYVAMPRHRCPEAASEYEWLPRPTVAEIDRARQQVRTLQGRGLAVCGAYACGVFEQAKHWFGDSETLTMPYDDPVRLERELDRIAEWKMGVYGAYVHAGVDIVWIGDDLGMQENLIMSPEQYRQWYRPRHLRIVEHLRGIRSDVHVAFHCCGYVTTLIPDLIEIGVDILEAVQAESMDIGQLKREFGRDLSFWGAVGAQSVLARATPEQVIDGVRKTLSFMAPGGGYIAAPCHGLTEEVPWESVLAFHDAVQRFGAYPFPMSCP